MIEIDSEKFKLSENNFHNKVSDKYQIVIGHTFSSDMGHYKSWMHRENGKYKNTAAFTIEMDGTIHQHYDPKYHSNFVGILGVDQFIIPILLENEGHLTKYEGKYYNWIGDIYNRVEEDIVEQKWRDYEYWAPYTVEQISATAELVKYLCGLFNIPLQVMEHHMQSDNTLDYNGVAYRSNYSKIFTDLSPAFNYLLVKNKIEIK